MKLFSDKYTADLLLREKGDFSHFCLQHGTHPPTFDFSMFYTEAENKYFSAYSQWRKNTLGKEIVSFGELSIRITPTLSMLTSSTAKILQYFKQVCQGRNTLLVISKPL